MNADEIMAYCDTFPAVTYDFPFGDEPRCYRIGGRIFAQVFPVGVEGALRILLEDDNIPKERVSPMVSLRCEPSWGDFYRRQFPGSVLRPYHSPPARQPYSNTVLLDGRVPPEVLREMIRHAYTVCRQRLPRQVQQELPPLAE